MRTIFIGDVHGCVRELTMLLDEVAPVDGDRVVFMGDLVDKGPDSVGALRIARDVVSRFPGSVAILGNHEKAWLRKHAKEPTIPDDLVDFVAAMPLFKRFPDIGRVAVHAGFFPKLFADGPLTDDDAIYPHPVKKRREALEKVAHTRCVNVEGGFVPYGSETPDTRHWSEVYDGSMGRAVFGHDPSRKPIRGPHAIGIDTGCVYGWALTACIVDDNGDESFVSVAADTAHAEPHGKE